MRLGTAAIRVSRKPQLSCQHVQPLPRRRTSRSGNGREEIQLAFGGAHFNRADVILADRVTLEVIRAGLAAAFHRRRPADAVSIRAAVQRRTCQRGKRGLKCIEAIVKGNSVCLRKATARWAGRSATEPRFLHLATVLIPCREPGSSGSLDFAVRATDRLCRGGAPM